MISLLSKVKIIDNSGGILGRCIKVLKPGKKPHAKIGDIILISIIKTTTGTSLLKGDIHKALVVRTSYNNTTVKWSDNSVVLIKGNKDPIGTRIKGPISSKITSLKINSLAKINI